MRRTLMGVLVGVSLCGWVSILPPVVDARIPRLRPLSERGERLLEVGRRLSPTIRAMLDRVEQSDIILQIDTRMDLAVPFAATRLVTATPDFRYVRMSINPRLSPARRIELLAHELQHVMEIASDPSIRDQDAMFDHFTRIGRRDRTTNAFETQAAIDVESVVRKELGKWASRELQRLDR